MLAFPPPPDDSPGQVKASYHTSLGPQPSSGQGRSAGVPPLRLIERLRTQAEVHPRRRSEMPLTAFPLTGRSAVNERKREKQGRESSQLGRRARAKATTALRGHSLSRNGVPKPLQILALERRVLGALMRVLWCELVCRQTRARAATSPNETLTATLSICSGSATRLRVSSTPSVVSFYRAIGYEYASASLDSMPTDVRYVVAL